MSRGATIAAVAGLLAFSASSTHEASTVAQPGASRVLLAEVLGSANQPLLGLDADTFAVDEGGEAREVFAAYPADYPVVILVDDTADAGELDIIRAAVDHFVGRLGQRPVVLGTLSRSTPITSIDAERTTLLEHVRSLSPVNAVPTPYAALADAVRSLEEADVTFSSVVVIASRPEEIPPPGSDAPLTPLLASRAIFHTVVKVPPPRPALDASTDQQSGVLRELANQSGGQYVTIYAISSYTAALDRLADRLAAETIIEYLVPPDSAPGGAVRVGVKIPGARVRGLGFGRTDRN
jgi:hypothetical protein